MMNFKYTFLIIAALLMQKNCAWCSENKFDVDQPAQSSGRKRLDEGQAVLEDADIGFNYAENIMFGNYNNSAINVTGLLTVTLPNGSSYLIELIPREYEDSSHPRYMMHNNIPLPYKLYLDICLTKVWGNTHYRDVDVIKGTGTGAAQHHTIYGRIPTNAGTISGHYTDTRTLVLNWCVIEAGSLEKKFFGHDKKIVICSTISKPLCE